AGIKGAIEPIRSAEVTIVHTVADAIAYIEAVDRPGIQHINGDVYHMHTEEAYIPRAVLAAGDRLVNLHLADSNRLGLGRGSMDIDTLIKALYLIGHNAPGRYVTPEPLGPGAGPYPAMHSRQDPAMLDELVFGTVAYWREREDAVRA
ncbi:MAG: TIM barrel protein, partial [Micrococcales bacterium]|nr:TIM barrel protein [Micrococcales bacterium]